MVMLMLLAFWFSLALLFYVYAGYVLLLLVVSRLRNRRVRKRPITPKISLIIAVYNEEDHIARRVENALALDYPSEALEIMVASDGSNDATESIVAKYAARGVRLLSLPRRGKIFALNSAAVEATGEILVFSDATSMFEKQALRQLAANFADSEVGGVAGIIIYTQEAHSDSWTKGGLLKISYDIWLKQMESLTGSIVSASGAIHAVRRGLYRMPADTATTDDFAISTAVIEQGYRLVLEKDARAYELAVPAASSEFSRKVRIITRGFQAVLLRKALLNPFRFGFYSIVLLTHKFIRRLVPFMLPGLLVSSLFLISHGLFYFSFAFLQLLFYALAFFGYVLRHRPLGRSRLLSIPFFYCLVNSAVPIALMNIIRGYRIEKWQPPRHTDTTTL